MAPAQQNVEMCTEEIHTELKKRPATNKSDDVISENNNTVQQDSEKVTSESDFDINKYETMEFRPRLRWPDLIVQISLHVVSLVGLYLIVTNQVRIYTILFVIATIYTSGFGITAGVHRLWSHRAYRAKLPLRIILAVLFTITGQRSPPSFRHAVACPAKFKKQNWRAAPSVILHEPFGATFIPLITQKLFYLFVSNLAPILRLARYTMCSKFHTHLKRLFRH